jgi:predicted ATP-dependent protease
VVCEVFTDQAYNLILAAEDEARMLGRAMVEPEHLLLALARRGNVESLLARRQVAGRMAPASGDSGRTAREAGLV